MSPDRNAARQRLTGILLVVLASCLFGWVDGFSKMLAETQSVGQIVWARYVMAFPVLIAATRPSELRALFATRHPALQILRGLTPLTISVTMVLAVRYLPLAEATVILFAAPFLVVALSGPMLGERVSASSWIGVLAGFAGVLVVARPGFGELSAFTVFPAIAAIFFALLQLVTRKAADLGERAETTLAWTLLVGGIASTPIAALSWAPLGIRGWALMLALGTVFGLSQLFMIRGLALGTASLLTPFTYVQIVSAVFVGLIVFADLPDAWTFLGIMLIAGAGIYVASRRTD
jgi:drug/metabolite transporter (DMT)-like permease